MKRLTFLLSAAFLIGLSAPLVSANVYGNSANFRGGNSTTHAYGTLGARINACIRNSLQQNALEPINTCATEQSTNLKLSMRKLWSDHIHWTRSYIVSFVAGLPDTEAAANRLLRNQDDIGNAIVPYYGSAAGAKLTSLLKEHILIAVDLLNAAKAGDTAKKQDADKRWHDNAADIATFLSSLNSAWPRQAVLDMLNQHLALTTEEAVNRLQGKWNEDVTNFDKLHDQALMMADTLSDGIIKQFPDRFCGMTMTTQSSRMPMSSASSSSRMSSASSLSSSSRSSSSSSSSSRSSSSSMSSSRLNVSIQNFAFNPSSVQVKAGTTVVWTNSDSAPHTVTGNNGGPMSPILNQGQQYSYTFSAPGTYPYHCMLHPSMTATVTVTP
jgi:plastocyanin